MFYKITESVFRYRLHFNLNIKPKILIFISINIRLLRHWLEIKITNMSQDKPNEIRCCSSLT